MEGPPAIAKVVRPKKSVKPRVKPQKMDDASEIPSVKATTGGKQKVVDPWAKKSEAFFVAFSTNMAGVCVCVCTCMYRLCL